jgi:hypothetical protein
MALPRKGVSWMPSASTSCERTTGAVIAALPHILDDS